MKRPLVSVILAVKRPFVSLVIGAKRLIAWAALAAVFVSPLTAQSATPYKLGTFDQQGRVFVGVVLRESQVIDLGAAMTANPRPGVAIPAPTDMKDLIARYETGLKDRIVAIVQTVANQPSGPRPAWLHELSALETLPPIMYPMTMMNVAVNYREHDIEMARVRSGATGVLTPTGGEVLPNTTSAPGIWERTANDTRWNPFIFLKAPAAIIANGEAIRIPPGRTQIEWECELAAVIGKTASRVPTNRAFEFIFGYTLTNDVSDRGGRGDTRYGSDWLVTKSHDTFAPMGPFITPKEFIPDVQRLSLRYSLNGQVLQEGTTAQMIHSIAEIVTYGTNILTLRAGDVIATGTPPGSGSARTPPVFFKPGDVSVCTYDGIGTLTNPVEGSR